MNNILDTYNFDIKVINKFLQAIEPDKEGVFIEAGANNGIFQSYTYPLEIQYGWKGVLIEPSVNGYNACKINRSKSVCINAALVDDPAIEYVSGDFDGNPMSSINGTRLNREIINQVPATTLTKVFDTHFKDTKVNLLSLDVENYEYYALKGLNFKIYQPEFILIEIYKDSLKAVDKLLTDNNYLLIENITSYNTKDYPNWDGTHNDYLYKFNGAK